MFASDASIDPAELQFDLNSFDALAAENGANPDACLDWVKTVVPGQKIKWSGNHYDDPDRGFWEPFILEDTPRILSPFSLPSSPAFDDASDPPPPPIPSYTPQPPLPIHGATSDIGVYTQPEAVGGSLQTHDMFSSLPQAQETFTSLPSSDIATATGINVGPSTFTNGSQVLVYDSSSYPHQAFDMGYTVSPKVNPHPTAWNPPHVVDPHFSQEFDLSISAMPYMHYAS